MKRLKSFTEYVPEVNGDLEKKQVVIYYNDKLDLFSIPIPEYMDTSAVRSQQSSIGGRKSPEGPVIRDGYVHAETPDKVREIFERLCRKYREGVRTSRKVILYILKYSLGGHDQEHREMAFEQGVGLALDWDVGWEIKLGSERAQYLDYDPCDPANKNLCTGRSMRLGGNGRVERESTIALDWTEEREEFFRKLDDRLKQLIANSRAYLDNGEDLVKLIESGTAMKALGFEKK